MLHVFLRTSNIGFALQHFNYSSHNPTAYRVGGLVKQYYRIR